MCVVVSGVADVMSAYLGVEDTAISRYYILTFSPDINLLNTHQNTNNETWNGLLAQTFLRCYNLLMIIIEYEAYSIQRILVSVPSATQTFYTQLDHSGDKAEKKLSTQSLPKFTKV